MRDLQSLQTRHNRAARLVRIPSMITVSIRMRMSSSAGSECIGVRGLLPAGCVADDVNSEALDGVTDRPWVTLREPVGVEGSVWRMRHPPTRDSLR